MFLILIRFLTNLNNHSWVFSSAAGLIYFSFKGQNVRELFSPWTLPLGRPGHRLQRCRGVCVDVLPETTRPAPCLRRGSIQAGPGRWRSTASGGRTHTKGLIKDEGGGCNSLVKGPLSARLHIKCPAIMWRIQSEQGGTGSISDSHLSGRAASAVPVSWRRIQTHQLSARGTSCRSWHRLRWRFPSSRLQRCRDTEQTTDWMSHRLNEPQTEWATDWMNHSRQLTLAC